MSGNQAMHPKRELEIMVLDTADRQAAYELLWAFKEESQRRSPVYDELRADYREILSRYIDEYISRPDCTVLVARVKENLVGIIMGSLWRYLPIYRIERMGYIPELYVVPQSRRQGIGSALVREMENWFRKQGVTFARIETILAYEHNQALYEGLGYKSFLVDLRRSLS